MKQLPQQDAPKAIVDFIAFYYKYLKGLQAVMDLVDPAEVFTLVKTLLNARERDQQIFIIGNGGSAANASHLANDLAKDRFNDEHLLFRVLSLTDCTPLLTATANDVGYEHIFASQLKSLLRSGDVVIAISSSGNSPSITKAVEWANSQDATTVGIFGFDGGALAKVCNEQIYIPTRKGQYGFMEDVTLILGHIVSIFLYEQDRAEKMSSDSASPTTT